MSEVKSILRDLRLVTDQMLREPSPDGWRCPHVHVAIQAAWYRRLISEIYFEGDPHQKEDGIFHPSLAVPVLKKMANGQAYETAVFDVVLDRA